MGRRCGCLYSGLVSRGRIVKNDKGNILFRMVNRASSLEPICSVSSTGASLIASSAAGSTSDDSGVNRTALHSGHFCCTSMTFVIHSSPKTCLHMVILGSCRASKQTAQSSCESIAICNISCSAALFSGVRSTSLFPDRCIRLLILSLHSIQWLHTWRMRSSSSRMKR